MANDYKKGERDDRPWGTWEVMDTGANFAVKKISVLPGHRLSYQVHHHRAEHWVVVSGNGRLTLDDVARDVGTNDHIQIAVGEKHCIENTGDVPMEFIEVQIGDELREDDIVRLDDPYNR